MRNLLQDRLLKAGLVKKSTVDQVVREQAKQRQGKSAAGATADSVAPVNTQQLQAERAERDRALAAERKEQARLGELRAQIRQIVDAHKVPRQGEIPYRFTDGKAIKSVLVNELQRTRLARGTLVIARLEEDHYELLPREAADKILARDAAVIVLDHARAAADTAAPAAESEDEHYRKFVVPDDLIW